jgi:hypothetical protein
MNKYELLTENKQLIYQFVKNGILSYLMIRDIEIYETYLNLNDNITKEIKYILLSDQYELSPDRIKQIIYQMQNDIIYTIIDQFNSWFFIYISDN